MWQIVLVLRLVLQLTEEREYLPCRTFFLSLLFWVKKIIRKDIFACLQIFSPYSTFVVTENSPTFRIKWTSEMTFSINQFAHYFNLIPSSFDVINIDWLLSAISSDIALTDSTIKRICPITSSQMPYNFTIPINSLKAPQWHFLLQGEKN